LFIKDEWLARAAERFGAYRVCRKLLKNLKFFFRTLAVLDI
jgi:hypothetical protein